jgi:hypothetical protein
MSFVTTQIEARFLTRPTEELKELLDICFGKSDEDEPTHHERVCEVPNIITRRQYAAFLGRDYMVVHSMLALQERMPACTNRILFSCHKIALVLLPSSVVRPVQGYIALVIE